METKSITIEEIKKFSKESLDLLSKEELVNMLLVLQEGYKDKEMWENHYKRRSERQEEILTAIGVSLDYYRKVKP